MNTMNAMSKETNKTQAMLYLENKRKMAETGQTANVSGEKDDNKFIKKLSKVNPADLIRMAKSDRITTAKTEAKIARIMVNNYYNKGKGATPLEYKFNF